MSSYCIKQRRITQSVPGSETHQKTNNGRIMMKSKCAECGITKTRFVTKCDIKRIERIERKELEIEKANFDAGLALARSSYKIKLRNKIPI